MSRPELVLSGAWLNRLSQWFSGWPVRTDMITCAIAALLKMAPRSLNTSDA